MNQDILEPGFVYHIYNRGNNKENLFNTDGNYTYFLNKVKFYLFPFCDIYAYCLMPNHFHLLLRIKELDELKGKSSKKMSQPFSNLFNSYTKSINQVSGRSGSLFQEHFQRERIVEDEYFRNALIYIHTNPVHHGFVGHYLEYKWSSIHEYRNNASGVISMNFPLQAFDGLENLILEHERKNSLLSGLFEMEE